MSQKLELSIEGKGNDGDVLVVDNWPNFKTMPMPKPTYTESTITVVRPTKEIRTVMQAYSPHVKWEHLPEDSNAHALFLWWLIWVTFVVLYCLFRDPDHYGKSRKAKR